MLSGAVANGSPDPTPTTTPTPTALPPTPTPIGDLPAPPAPTLDVTPASPVPVGTTSTLTATVNPVAPYPLKAGFVQFLDGSTPIGGTVPVSGGTASMTTVLPPGTHRLSASLLQTDPYSPFPSGSPAVTYVVNPLPVATATTTMLNVLPNRVFEGIPAIFLANVAPPGAAGTVQFMNGTTALGAPAPVTAGFALLITTLQKGTHSLSAVFTPANPAVFAPSTSSLLSLTVSPLY